LNVDTANPDILALIIPDARESANVAYKLFSNDSNFAVSFETGRVITVLETDDSGITVLLVTGGFVVVVVVVVIPLTPVYRTRLVETRFLDAVRLLLLLVCCTTELEAEIFELSGWTEFFEELLWSFDVITDDLVLLSKLDGEGELVLLLLDRGLLLFSLVIVLVLGT